MTTGLHASASRRGAGPARRRPVAWILAVLLGLAIAVVAVSPYLLHSLDDLARSDGVLARVYAGQPLWVRAAFYAHVVGGGTALVLVPWQFSDRWRGDPGRRRGRRRHHVAGRTAVVAAVLAGIAGLIIAPHNSAGPTGFVGFSMLAAVWSFSAWKTYRTAVTRDLSGHRAWAMRTFALTFAAVTLRLWLGVLVGVETVLLGRTGEDAFRAAYVFVPFLCWVPNLVVAELLVRRRRPLVDPPAPEPRGGGFPDAAGTRHG
jgi:hypothetical protein